jgi:dolichol-phosphate mannosyltransferase
MEEKISNPGSDIKTACIVMPTYNESSNIGSTLDTIYFYKKKNSADIVLHVLVVDDNSPDRTYEIVEEYTKKNPHVHLLLRKNKEGLGAAYVHGIKYALENIHPQVIFEMDADGQHDPKDIFRMLEEINKGYDFVIGSRYIEGGQIPENWGILRKIKSFAASNISKIGLGLRGIRDISGGFRAIRATVFDKISLDSISSKGYAFQAEILENIFYNKFRIKEIPITFNERIAGDSKMRAIDILEGWKIIFKIRKKRILEKIKK